MIPSKPQDHVSHSLIETENLAKQWLGDIDTKEEAFKFLEWSNSVRINDVGLVSLMPINDYSKENYN